MNLRVLAVLTLFATSLSEKLFADLVPGGTAITTAATPVVVNGKATGTIEAGQSVTVLGVQAASRQAAISYQPPAGAKIVGLVSLDSLISVDGVAPTSAPTGSAPAAAPVVAATPPPVTLDLSKILDSVEIAQLFKNDKAAAKSKCEGQRIKFKGVIDKVEIEKSSSNNESPVLVLRSASGLPRLKVKLSNTLGNNDTFFRRFTGYIPDWWWGYGERSIDYKIVDLKEIQVRAVYRYNRTTRWSDGTSYTSRSKSNSDWFTIFKVGEMVTVEGTCKGLYMDVEFENGAML